MSHEHDPSPRSTGTGTGTNTTTTTTTTSIWGNRSFTLLFLAEVISLLGSGATTIGLALFAYEMAGAGSATAVVGNALTLRILAFLMFSQPAGVLADRMNRKSILIASDVIRAGLLLTLPFASEVWHIYVLIFALNAVTAFFTPTFESCIPAVVGEQRIVKALAYSRIAVDIEAVAAPAAAGLIIAIVGARWVFWFDAATYVVSALLVLGAVIPKGAPSATKLSLQAFLGEITYGTRAILRQPALRQALLMSFVESIAGAVAIVATVVYIRDTLDRGEMSVSIAMAAIGVGSTLTALLLGRATGRYEAGARDKAILHGRRHEWTARSLLLGGLCLSAALLPGFLVPGFLLLIALWALNGAGQALIAIPSSTLLAEHTFEGERGKVYAAHFALTHACWLVTYPAVGHAATRWSTPTVFSFAGGCCLFLTALAWRIGTKPSAHVHEQHSTHDHDHDYGHNHGHDS